MVNRKITKPIGMVLTLLIVIVMLGLSTTWFLFELFPSEIKLQISKAGITATIFGASALFLMTTWLFTSIYIKLLKAVAPAIVLSVIVFYAYQQPEYYAYSPKFAHKDSSDATAIKSIETTGQRSPDVIITSPDNMTRNAANDHEIALTLIQYLDDPDKRDGAHQRLIELSNNDFGFNKKKWLNWLEKAESSLGYQPNKDALTPRSSGTAQKRAAP